MRAYNEPNYVLGVGGRDGKTTVADILYHDGTVGGEHYRAATVRFDAEKGGATAVELARLQSLVDAANRGLGVAEPDAVVEGMP